MSPRSALSMLSVIIVWAAFVGGIGYWQQHRKHPAQEPVLIHTGIEKRAKIVTDTYAPPPGSLADVPLPRPRSSTGAPLSEAEMKAWCDREHGDYRGKGSCRFKFFAHNASPETKDVDITPTPIIRPYVAPGKPAKVIANAQHKVIAIKRMSMAEKVARCTPDALRLCKAEIPHRDKIIACLQSKRDQLSKRCAPVFAAPKLDAAVPLKASKADPCALKGTSHRTATKHKSHRAVTVAPPEEYHDGASQWSRDHPGPIPNSGTSVPDLGSGHGGHHHAGGHHHHSPPPHHTLC